MRLIPGRSGAGAAGQPVGNPQFPAARRRMFGGEDNMTVELRRIATWLCARCAVRTETAVTEPVRADQRAPPLPEGWLVVRWTQRGHQTARPYVTTDTHRLVGTELHWAHDGGGGGAEEHFCGACAKEVLGVLKTDESIRTITRAVDTGELVRTRDRYKAVVEQAINLLDAARGRKPRNCGPAVPPRQVEDEIRRLEILLEGLGLREAP